MKPDWTSDNGDIQLYCGDALRVLPELEAGSVDGIITDPPYSSGGQFRGDRMAATISKYVQTGSSAQRQEFSGDNRDQRSYLAWCTLWMTACSHIANAGAVLCCFSDWRQVPILTDAVQCGGWTWRNLCTWWKPGCRMQRGRFSSSSEFLVYATCGAHASDGAESPQNVLQCCTLIGDEKQHIAEKPAAVMSWACSVVRKQGVILDPFMGAATTAAACIRHGRRFIGIEIDEGYFNIAVKRIQTAIDDWGLFGKTR